LKYQGRLEAFRMSPLNAMECVIFLALRLTLAKSKTCLPALSA
jgi:hypothetical protein